MVYIISTLLRKAYENKKNKFKSLDDVWKSLMLLPKDYSHNALFHPQTRVLMEKCTFEHGGQEYDSKYPEGIPTSIIVTFKNGNKLDSGLIMFPSGHSKNTTANLKDILHYKFNTLGRLALSEKDLAAKLEKLHKL